MKAVPIIEEQFFKLFEKEITVEQFEAWVYTNEVLTSKETNPDLFEDLIIIDYTSQEAKHEFKRLINPNFQNLYKKKIVLFIKKSIESKVNQIHDVEYVLCYDDLDNSNYSIDNTNGIAIVYFTQFSPFNDQESYDFYRLHEKEVYENIN